MGHVPLHSRQAAFDPIDAKGLSNLLLDWADWDGISVSPMKLQKLLYYCHADFLVMTGRPLVRQEFEAWEFGPVIPSLFHEFKSFEAKPIECRAFIFNPVTCNRELALPGNLGDYAPVVRSTFEIYSRCTASALSNMSHSESGPWAETLRRFSRGSLRGRCIDNEVILRYHETPVDRAIH